MRVARGCVLARRALASFALALAVLPADPARAGRLLAPVTSAPRALPRGVSRGQALALGRAALAELRRAPASGVVDAFPLGVDGTADLDVRRFEPFSPGARVESVGDAGVRAVPLPDQVYFTGTVRGDAASRVLLVAGPDRVHGFVATKGTLYQFGPDAAGRHRSWALRDVDPTRWPPPGDFCANDLHRDKVDSPVVNRLAREALGLESPPVARTTGVVGADAAIETDHELWAKFGSDAGTLDYLASLVAAVSAIDERDLGVRLQFSYIRLWASASDPWTATAPDGQLDELRTYWTNPANDMNAVAGPHDLVHFVSGKAVQGGIAYIGSVCDPSYEYGVSQVYGHFDVSTPSQIWDVLVATHEMGHNFGTPHTHCYSPPLDECYNQEPGCYAGPAVCSHGTIMSYCHLCGGLSNVDLAFGTVVSDHVRAQISGASCLTVVATCGNGVVEPGEECDDGNTTAGDGCSATCRREVCGNGVLDPGEECDDGNTTPGDGCTATCRLEPCRIMRSGQTLWLRSMVSVQHGASRRDRLVVRAEFALPNAFDALGLASTGAMLMLQTASGEVDATLPPGARWTAHRGRSVYRDPSGSVAGIRRLEIRDDTRGGVPGVKVSVVGRNGAYPVEIGSLPLVVTIVVGDQTAGLAGSCGRRSFDAGSCTSIRGGARVVCH
jgi:cysteine-rich repeat protein